MPQIIDADTHVAEPTDLWAHVAPKGREREGPHIRPDDRGRDAWFIGDKRIRAIELAGQTERTPIEAGDAIKRLAWMDKHGFWAQVLYPNSAGFMIGDIAEIADQSISLNCVRTYNDWLADWVKPGAGRLIPTGFLPIWDIDESVREAGRLAKLGHVGAIFPSFPKTFGLPHLVERHWDPIWQACEREGLSVHFHAGIGKADQIRGDREWQTLGPRTAHAIGSTLAFSENAAVLVNLMFSGILARYPKLQFVSVESGIGYIPYILEACDWQFINHHVGEERTEFKGELPSDYFRRQVYTMYWFERAAPERMLDVIGADHVMYETDFPHGTGVVQHAKALNRPIGDVVMESAASLPADKRDAVLWGNAAKLYHLTAPAA